MVFQIQGNFLDNVLLVVLNQVTTFNNKLFELSCLFVFLSSYLLLILLTGTYLTLDSNLPIPHLIFSGLKPKKKPLRHIIKIKVSTHLSIIITLVVYHNSSTNEAYASLKSVVLFLFWMFRVIYICPCRVGI